MIKNIRVSTALNGVALSLSLLAAACSGGTGSDDTGGSTDAGSGDIITTGKVQDESGMGLSGVDVTVNIDQKNYSTTSGADGNYALHTPKSANYPAVFSGLFTRSGYLPSPILFAYSNGALSVDGASANPKLAAADETDIIFPNGQTVVHLGDAVFNGSANSQFQKPTSGFAWQDSNYVLNSELASKYHYVTLTLYMKGVEASVCPDTISVADGTVIAGTYTNQYLQSTDSAGGYTKVSYKFPLTSVKANDILLAQINSAACTTGDQGDDFEFINVLGKLSAN